MKPLAVSTVCGIKNRVNPEPDFQRPPVWRRSQKQLLIDSILRGYDIPKFYWRKVGKSPEKYDVVDGQQRLRAIWEFQDGGYRLAKDADPVNGYAIASLGYAELPTDLRQQFDTYTLHVIILSDTHDDEDEVRELFLRLQNGTTLKAQEKRNAMPGNMRDFVKNLAKHPFFENCGFSNTRYAFDHMAAQMTLMELTGGPCNIRDSAMNRMYEDNKTFDPASAKAKKVRRVLDFLLQAFPAKTPELERYSVISLYALASYLLERYVFADRHGDLRAWFLEFEEYRRWQETLDPDKADPEVLIYKEKVSSSTDAPDSLTWRHEFMLRKFLEKYPETLLKDDKRLFTHEQRIAIFRRDRGVCKVRLKCDGVKCDWGNWEADHIVSWSSGGRTTVANGQVACPACNSAKGAGLGSRTDKSG